MYINSFSNGLSAFITKGPEEIINARTVVAKLC